MKKYFYLLAVICTLGFTACSSDDDNNNTQRLEALEGTWNVEKTVTKDEGLYDGSVQLNWEGKEGTSINIPMGDASIPMDIKQTALPLAANMANTSLPTVFKSVTFNADGTLTAQYKDEATDTDWKTATGYATYKVVNDNLIMLYLNSDKITENLDAEEKAQLSNILNQYSKEGIPVNLRWNSDKSKVYFYVDKNFVQPLITSLAAMLDKVQETEDNAETLKMIKGIATQLPTIMSNTTKFEAGIELQK